MRIRHAPLFVRRSDRLAITQSRDANDSIRDFSRDAYISLLLIFGTDKTKRRRVGPHAFKCTLITHELMRSQKYSAMRGGTLLSRRRCEGFFCEIGGHRALRVYLIVCERAWYFIKAFIEENLRNARAGVACLRESLLYIFAERISNISRSARAL